MGEYEKSLSSITITKAHATVEEDLKRHLPPWEFSNGSQKCYLLFLYSLICLPVVVLLFVVIGGYVIYVRFYIYYLVFDSDDSPEMYYWHSDSEKRHARIRGTVYLCIETISIILLLVSHFRAMFTDPGSIPASAPWEVPSDGSSESGSDKRMAEKSKRGLTRSCNHCKKKKPDRTHHCRQCNRCNLKMDHHCNWIANCVGYYNYKFFFLIVFYGSIALGLFIGTFWECVVVTLNDDENSTFHCFFIVVSYSLISLLGFAVIGFCIFHIWLIYNNFTTIEYCEKKRKNAPGYDSSPFAADTVYENFKESLGKNPLFWLIPLNYREEGGGLYYR
jgi:hypothetical protein